MSNIIEQLKSGKCLCLKCKKVQPAGFMIHGQRYRDPFTACYDNCEYDNGLTVAVLTWNGVQNGEPTQDGISVADFNWLKTNYPEIIEEWERVEASQVAQQEQLRAGEAEILRLRDELMAAE